MAVEQFTDGIQPDDPEAVVWRFMELWKFRDLLESGQLYFRRSDKLEDVDEGVSVSALFDGALVTEIDGRLG